MRRCFAFALALLAFVGAKPVVAQTDTIARALAAKANQQSLPRSDNAFVLIGDSRLAQYTEDSLGRNKNARHWLAVANQILGQGFDVVANFSTSGYRSDQYLTQANISAAIATNARWVVVWGVINDVSQGYTAAQVWGGANGAPGLRSALAQFRAAGMQVILPLEPGSTSVAGNNAMLGEIAKYNSKVRGYAAANAGVIVFDVPVQITDPTTSTLTFKAGLLLDGTHPANAGGQTIGAAFAPLIAPFLPARAVLPWARQNNATVGVSFSANPLFSTLTGGTVGAGITAGGGVPLGYVAACSTGVTGTLTSAAGLVGNDVTLAVTATQAGYCRLTYDMAGEVTGDVVEAVVQVDIAAGSTGMEGPALYLQSNITGDVRESYDNYWGASQGAGLATARTLTLRTVPFTIGSGTRNWFTSYLYVHFAAAGAGTVTFRQHEARRVLAP